MKVILKQDVVKLGSLGDEAVVKRGYARNYLIPKGLAVPLTRDNMKQIQHQRQILSKQRADAIAGHQEMAKKLEDTEIVFTMKSGENGKLFGSVTMKHIHDALVNQGIEVDRKKMSLPGPIKTLGSHMITVRLHTEVSANLEVKITADANAEPAPAKADEESEVSSSESEVETKEN